MALTIQSQTLPAPTPSRRSGLRRAVGRARSPNAPDREASDMEAPKDSTEAAGDSAEHCTSKSASNKDHGMNGGPAHPQQEDIQEQNGQADTRSAKVTIEDVGYDNDMDEDAGTRGEATSQEVGTTDHDDERINEPHKEDVSHAPQGRKASVVDNLEWEGPPADTAYP